MALLKLGMPLAVITWLIFSWMYREDMLDVDGDRKSTSEELKRIKKSHKQEKGKQQHYLFGKWMWFGSGFYGLTALWTFIVVEFLDVFNFVFSFPGFATLFGDGFIAFLLSAILNQLSNIVTAFVWFNYWSDDSIIVWVVVAYAGYMVGMSAAKRTHKSNVTRSTGHSD